MKFYKGFILAVILVIPFWAVVYAQVADQVVKVDDLTIAITKTDNVKLPDAQSEIANLKNQIVELDKSVSDTLAQKDIVMARIQELQGQFQSVGIDPNKPVDNAQPADAQIVNP